MNEVLLSGLAGIWQFTCRHVINTQSPASWKVSEFNGIMPEPGICLDYRFVELPLGTNPRDATLPFLLGVGWYRRKFRIPISWGPKSVTLRLGLWGLTALLLILAMNGTAETEANEPLAPLSVTARPVDCGWMLRLRDRSNAEAIVDAPEPIEDPETRMALGMAGADDDHRPPKADCGGEIASPSSGPGVRTARGTPPVAEGVSADPASATPLTRGLAHGSNDQAYQFAPLAESLPGAPWHTHFIDESTGTPEGAPNAGMAYMNDFLKACMQDRLEKTAAQTPWRNYSKFLKWAMWGYLSPDSDYTGDERLIEMSCEWMDQLFTTLQTKPADPDKAKDWRPDSLGTWNFGDYSTPMLEIEARPELAGKLGSARVARYREILLQNIRHHTRHEAWNSLFERAQPYINIATHPMAVYVHGWLLTGDETCWRMAASLVAILARDQLPNGMFPYRYKIYGDDHCEFEGMYYHAINVRALYMYWWATGSEVARQVLEKSVPYYPLNMEPPYSFNDGPAIWWKNIWRTFWSQHIAMVAAVTGDGENARIALDMARDGISHDRFDLVLGAHAYQRMARQDIEPKPVRNRYIICDPDIRGLRLRFPPWSSTFTVGSFTYTRASAMLICQGQAFDALHMARPYLRVSPLEKKPRYEQDFGTLGRHGAGFTAALADNASAVATRYRLASTAQTWRDEQSLAPFDMTELWIMTAQGMIGLIDSQAVEAFEAYELNHQFRFIHAKREAGEKTGERQWQCGGLKFRVWDTDFPFAIEERTRRFAMAGNQRIDWQISLADMDRLPEHIAQDGPPPPPAPAEPEVNEETVAALAERELTGAPKAGALPERRTLPVGYRRFSVVEVSPANAGFGKVETISRAPLLVLRGETESETWIAVYNPTDAPLDWLTPEEQSVISCSWTEAMIAKPRQPIVVPAGASALVHIDE